MSDDLEKLRRRQDGLDARMDAIQKQLDEVKNLLIGEQRELAQDEVEEVRNYFDRIADAEAELQELNQQTRAAIATSGARVDGGNPSKKEIAKRKARNRLVTNAAGSSATKHKVRHSKVKEDIDRANVAYQTVKDACDDLAAQWDAFRVSTDESGKKILAMDANKVCKELAYVVEEDLGRDDLAKRLISQRTAEGGI